MTMSKESTMAFVPDTLIVPPRLEKWAFYVAGLTATAWSLPGAERVSHPRFGSWLVTKWKTANIGYGGGHKWKRRAGVPIDGDGYYE
jgi:hypothetical protein